MKLSDYVDSADHLAECNAMIDAIKTFEKATEELKQKNIALDEAITKANEITQKNEKALDETLKDSLKTSISNAKAAVTVIPQMPESSEERMIANTVSPLSVTFLK